MAKSNGRFKFRRMVFFGAGFSAGVCYPVGRSLLPQLVDYLKGDTARLPITKAYRGFYNSLQEPEYRDQARALLRKIKRFLREYFALSLNRIGDVDPAEFFTIAQALSETPAVFEHERGRQQASFDSLYEDLASTVRTYFIDLTAAIRQLPRNMREVLDDLDPTTDAIVNFNWDEEIDYYLANCERSLKNSVDVAYTLRSWRGAETFLVLKPHGSISWYDLVQGTGQKEFFFVADHDDTRIKRFDKRIVTSPEVDLPEDISDPDLYFPFSCPPVIMPPTFSKRFKYAEQQLIWQDVLQACRDVRQFVFIGYSLPRDDFLTRAAIRSAIGKNKRQPHCLVIGHDKRTLENYETLFRKDHLKFVPCEFGKRRRGRKRR